MNSNKENKPDDKHDDDAVLKAFLQLLEKDIKDNPQNLKRITEEDFARWRKLTDGIEVPDINSPLLDEDQD